MQTVKTATFQLAIKEFGKKDEKKVAILLPGRLDTKDYVNFSKHGEFFASQGFYTLTFDPPGTWDSPGGTDLFTSTNYLKSVNELIDYLGNRPTILLGHSRGGFTANIVGTENQYVIGIISLMPSFGPPYPPEENQIKGNVYVDHRDLPPGNIKTKEQKLFKVPLSYFEDGSKYNDAEILKKCRKPKLIFYAKKDEFNTPEEVKEIFDNLPSPKKLVGLNCTHDYRYYPEIVNYVNKEIAIFILRISRISKQLSTP